MIECNMNGCAACGWDDVLEECVEKEEEAIIDDNNSDNDISDEEWAELEIYNIQGVLIRKSRLDALVNRISLYDIPSGIYILFLKNSHGKSYHKLVVQ